MVWLITLEEIEMNSTRIDLLIALVFALACTGCITEEFFGLSDQGNIRNIEVSNQAGQAVINLDSFTVKLEIPTGVDASELSIKLLKLSSFATSNKTVGNVLDLTKNAAITITSESGLSYDWTIIPFIASENPQLPNSDLNLWYQTSSGYYEPGENANTTIWGTGNPGTQLLGLTATTPFEIGDDNLAAKLETLDNGPIAGAFGTPISAGSIFTGVFNSDNLDPSNPSAAIEFGTPFAGRPTKFKFKYSYTPGQTNKDRKGNELSYGDACDIYAILEVRSSNQVKRLATAWFRNDQTQAEFIEQEVKFTYGMLDDSFPDYSKPDNGNYVGSDSASYILPSHITIVATSSFDGEVFAGAIGSTLVFDDIELIY